MKFTSVVLTVLASSGVTSSSAEEPSIAALVSTLSPLSSLLDAVVTQGDYVESLSDCESGPFTVFAPVDTAFETDLPDIYGAIDVVKEGGSMAEVAKVFMGHVLGFHVVKGEVLASDIIDGAELTTLIGEDVEANVRQSNGAIRINPTSHHFGAKVLIGDFKACNGVVHLINSVLIPPEASSDDGMEESDSHDSHSHDEASSDDGAEEASSDDGAEEASSDDGAEEASSDDGMKESDSHDGYYETHSHSHDSHDGYYETHSHSHDEASSDDGAEEASSDDGAEEASSDDGAEEASSDDGVEEASSDDGAEEASSDDGAEEASSDDGTVVKRPTGPRVDDD